MIAKGNQSAESAARKLYIGVGAVKVLTVNPNKAELEKIYGREMENEPVYLSTQEIDGKQVPVVRVTFVVEATPEKNNGISTCTNHTIFLKKSYVKSKDGKYKIIDKYGRTAWVTAEEGQAKAIPQYQNGPANIDTDYRGCYEGEEELTSFVKNLLNIPNVTVFLEDRKCWVPNQRVEAADCEVRFDSIEDFFKGNLKELKEAISYQPNNYVKIPFGVRNDTDKNRLLQTTYTRISFKNAATDYSKLGAEIAKSREYGGLSNVEFETCDLKEYEVASTNLTPSVGEPSLKEAAAANVAGKTTPW